ncbi:MAG: Maf family protein [Bacillota bacterium]
MRLILASESERRRDLLLAAGLVPEVVPSSVDETFDGDWRDPADMVVALARRKVKAVSLNYPEDYVLGADTVVSISGEILGKPRDTQEAREMLSLLQGKTHQVYTGVALYDPRTKKTIADWDCTSVTFRPMNDYEIAWYVSTREPMDKAGAYALQGIGAFFVQKIDGDYSSVIGLPLPKVYELFRDADVNIGDF